MPGFRNRTSTLKFSSRALLGIAKRLPRGYWPIIRAAANRDLSLQDLVIELKGISRTLRADLRETVFVPLYLHGRIPHQIGFDGLCRRALWAGDRVFDVGANVGYTSALFSDLVGEDGKVLAIEPSPRAFALLRRSLAGVSNIELVNTGVSSCEGELTFYVPPELDRASLVPINGAKEVMIPAVTVDALGARHGHPTFLKFDVEGHEPEVFAGAAATLARNDRPIIVFEALDPTALRQCLDVLEELSDRSYRFLRIKNDGALVPIDAVEGSSDYLAMPAWAESRLSPVAE